MNLISNLGIEGDFAVDPSIQFGKDGKGKDKEKEKPVLKEDQV